MSWEVHRQQPRELTRSPWSSTEPQGDMETIFSSPHQKPGQFISYKTIKTHLWEKMVHFFQFLRLATAPSFLCPEDCRAILPPLPTRLVCTCSSCRADPWVLSSAKLPIQTSQTTLLAESHRPAFSFPALTTAAAHW